MAFPPWLGLISNVFLSLFISLPLSLCLFISVQGTEKEICLSVRGYPFIWSTTGHFLEQRISFYLVNQWTFPRGENILLSGQQLDIFQRRGYPYYLEPQLQHISQRRGYPYYLVNQWTFLRGEDILLSGQLVDISQRRGYFVSVTSSTTSLTLLQARMIKSSNHHHGRSKARMSAHMVSERSFIDLIFCPGLKYLGFLRM